MDEKITALARSIRVLAEHAIADITDHSTTGKVGDETGCPIFFSEARMPYYGIAALAEKIENMTNEQ